MHILLMYEPSPPHRVALQAAAPGATLLIARDEAGAQRSICDADAVLGNRFFLQSLPHARRLRWMQSNSMGVDRILLADAPPRGVAITNARGVYDDEIAEHAVALVLALARGLHRARDDQHRRHWVRRPLRTVGGCNALILGWGGVGRAIARRLAALDMQVAGVRRTHEGPPSADATGHLLWGPSNWREALPRTNLLVLALPLTSATGHVVGRAELAALPPNAWVVNVGRGGTLDERALHQALRDEHLDGAALDVLDEEPPPEEHPLWTEPRALLTPHVARSMEEAPFRWEPLFVENLRRFAAGEPLLNVVDPDAGY